MPDNPQLSVLKSIRLILGSSKKHYRRIEAECGLSGAALWALVEIAERPGLSVSDLARMLAVHQTTASNLLQRLEQAGLVARTRADTDLRVVLLRPTDAGLALLSRAPKPVRGVLQEALLRLPPDALADLDRALGALIEQMEHVDRESATRPIAEM